MPSPTGSGIPAPTSGSSPDPYQGEFPRPVPPAPQRHRRDLSHFFPQRAAGTAPMSPCRLSLRIPRATRGDRVRVEKQRGDIAISRRGRSSGRGRVCPPGGESDVSGHRIPWHLASAERPLALRPHPLPSRRRGREDATSAEVSGPWGGRGFRTGVPWHRRIGAASMGYRHIRLS